MIDQEDPSAPDARRFGSRFPEWAMERAAGGPRFDGNSLRLQFDGPQTFEDWLEAIDSAKRYIHFENYVFRDDRVGRAFRDAMVARAREGIQVRLIYDWMGCWATPRRYWKPYREAGVEVRAFNRPSLRDPFGLLQRDHRKVVCVDGEVAFVGGFCVGNEWAGDGMEPPWRDTGVEIRGPAAAASARAFERIWASIGDPVSEEIRASPEEASPAGDIPVWLIEGEPWRSRVYRVTQLVAAGARMRLWITDPYFLAPRPVVESFTAAARDGVDVRILVPAHSNWPMVGGLSRGGYRSLLEAGVRLFEWQGPMIHAKTAVADGMWSRIGSSNLNSASLLGNWEIDVGVVDPDLASQVEALFLADLASSVEIVLPGKVAVPALPGVPEEEKEAAPRKTALMAEGTLQERMEYWRMSPPPGSTRWRLTDLVRVGSTFGDAIAGRRTLPREDRTVLGTVATLVLVIAGISAVFPWIVGWFVAIVSGWFGIVLGFRALHHARRARKEDADTNEDSE